MLIMELYTRSSDFGKLYFSMYRTSGVTTSRVESKVTRPLCVVANCLLVRTPHVYVHLCESHFSLPFWKHWPSSPPDDVSKQQMSLTVKVGKMVC